jgi:hypothetical protein
MSQQSGAGVVELSNAESLFFLRATAPARATQWRDEAAALRLS